MPSSRRARSLGALLFTTLVSLAMAAGAGAATPLSQLTDLRAGQVAGQHTCGAAAPGYATCEAQVLKLRSDGAWVHPRMRRERTLAAVTPRVSHALAAHAVAAPGDAAAQSAPQPFTPAYLQQAYDLTYLSATRGTGDTVAIVDAYDDPTAASDLATFRSNYGLPACTTANGCFAKVNQSGQTSPLPSANSGWGMEESLDLDAVSSLCPNCHILLVEASSTSFSDLQSAMATADGMGANQISDSWSGNASYAMGNYYTFTFPGVATIAATGDNGYVGAHVDSYPAAVPGVTAAGGTSLAQTAAANLRGFDETGWSGAGSGCDLNEAKPSYQTDTGCTGRSYSDVSADADPNSGLAVYDTGQGGWILVGGTSLATPLIAAYEAITGVSGATPQWAYTDQSLLNDPAAGSNGSCALTILYICNGRAGYDGPTGEGSISGQVITGAPGIAGPSVASSPTNTYAQSVQTTTATMAGGVYPNGNDTTYWWQYGTTTAYGQQTSAVDLGAGAQLAQAPGVLSGLSPSTTYHYRLVAQNTAGTTYGYDYTLTTPAVWTQPVSGGSTGSGSGSSSSGSSSSGTSGSSTSGSDSSGSGSSSSGSSSSGSGSGSGSTGSGSSSGSGSSGSGAGTPPSTSPSPSAPSVLRSPAVAGAARVGARVRLNSGQYSGGTIRSINWQRCAASCSTIATGAGSLKLTNADAGTYLRVVVTVRGAGGTVTATSNEIGPVASPRAGAARVTARVAAKRSPERPARARAASAVVRTRVNVRSATGRTLARATVAFTGTSARVLISPPAGVTVRACLLIGGQSAFCTSTSGAGTPLSFTLKLSAGQQLELIAVKR